MTCCERPSTWTLPPPTVTRGNYLTVWKKQADNTWLVVFDTGSTFPGK